MENLNVNSGYNYYWESNPGKYNFFIEDKALFGAYPTQKNIIDLENMGVRHFLDLTVNFEKGTEKYSTKYNYENYPIPDRNIPRDTISFSKLIVKYCDIISNLKNGELVYIHCRGGHGRSSLLCICILVCLYKIGANKAIEIVTKYHSDRPFLRDKWKKLEIPNNRNQKMFIHYFFKPIYLFMISREQFPTKCIYEFCREIVYRNLYSKEEISILFENNKGYITDLLKTGLKRLIFNYSYNIGYNRHISNVLAEIRLEYIRELL